MSGFNPGLDNYTAARDANRIPIATGLSNTDSTQTLPFKIDSVTGRLLVDNGGSSAGTVVTGEVVAGSGTSWTLAHTPNANGVALYANGQRLTLTVDYSIVGTAITTVLSWSAGTLLADYTY